MTLYVGKFELKYTGSIHLKNFYKEVHDWFVAKEYVKSRSGPEFPEIYYSDSRSQPGGQEVWIWWRLKRNPQNNPFYAYVIRLNFHCFRMKEIETVQDSKKVKLHWAEHKLIITAILETDFQKTWREHWLMKHFYELFWKKIMWKNIEDQKKILLTDVYELQKVVKSYYGAAHWEQEPHPFRPKHGLNESVPMGP